METYCVSFEKNTAKKNSSVRRTKQNRLTLVSNCGVCSLRSPLSSIQQLLVSVIKS